MSDPDDFDALLDALPDKYELEREPESNAIRVHRRDGSPIARLDLDTRVLATDIVVDLGGVSEATDEARLRQIGERAVDALDDAWRKQGFEHAEPVLETAEDPDDGTETPIYVARLETSVVSADQVADLVGWLVRRDHFHYADEILDL
jgi:hypothetical protein